MALLAPFSAPGRFWRGNIHTHSNLSDGKLAPAEVVQAYKDAGYDFMQLSEHFIGNFDWPIADTRSFRSNDFTTLIGAELHAPVTAVGELWHIVAAGLPLDFPKNLDGETGVRVAARAREAGAFIGIAHPAWSQLTMEDGRSIASAHAVEIYNHGCAVENDRGDGWYLLDQMMTEGHRLTAFATDDAHFKTNDGCGGWMMVKAEDNEPAALVEAMKAGNFYSSQGPAIHEFAVEDGEVRVKCSPVVTILLLGRGTRNESRCGRQISRASLSIEKFRGDWMRLVVIDEAGKSAWSNPVWLP